MSGRAKVARPTPSIKDVAARAGVSPSTVSRVLAGAARVGSPTRERVLEAVAELGYQPNWLASSLRRGRTGTLGLVLPDLRQPFFVAMAVAVEDAVVRRGYGLLLCNSRLDAEREGECLRVLAGRGVDGILFARVADDAETLRRTRRSGVPLVVVDRVLDAERVPSVVVDNRRAGYLAVGHLTALGHRRIGLITGPRHLHLCRDRYQGYERALRERGLEPDPRLEVEGDFSLESGADALTRLLDARPRPTAVFAMNDLMAIGALRAARANGVSVPGDLAVVGIDNIPLSALVEPSLTTVAQPLDRMAEEAVDLLLQAMERPLDQPVVRVVLDPHLVVRRSTGAPRALEQETRGT
ncbi:MAG TPA: LacI family DNA-binding transcriptional regulator [Chloroflexota bacterium]